MLVTTLLVGKRKPIPLRSVDNFKNAGKDLDALLCALKSTSYIADILEVYDDEN